MNYRKIYENYYGPIPKDSSGRTYDIHHRDGNRLNNDPLNLVALSVQEHYDVHYAQGDYGACSKIKRDMHLTKEEMSKLATDLNLKKVKNGTHNFLGGEVARDTQRRLVAEGKHHWLSGNAQRISTAKRLKDGTHPFQVSWTCQHCGISGKNKAMYNRWHNDNCGENQSNKY